MTIINKKNITTSGFDADALFTTKNGESIINFGDLTTTGNLANGIYAGANSVSIRNVGHIETFGLGAAGIFANGANAYVENDGTVVTHGGYYDPDPKVDGDEVYSEGMFANGDGFHIVNYGSIRVEGLASSALIGSGANGTLVNAGSIYSTAPGAGGVIFALGEGAQEINTGEVTVVANDITALRVGGGTNGHLINDGLIHVSGDNSFGILGLGDGHNIDNSGSIAIEGTHAIGIEGLGSHLFPNGLGINIINSGQIATKGPIAIGIALGLPIVPPGTATDSLITNSGVINTDGDGAAGVLIFGDGNQLTNSGQIITNGGATDGGVAILHSAGVLVSGDATLVENSSSGVIESKNAASAAVELDALKQSGLNNAKTSARLENYGLIKGASVAVLGGDGAETVVNYGQITGDVILGNGADTFVFATGGRLTGMLFIGGGNDSVQIEKGSGSMTIADFAAGPATKDIIDISAFYSNFGDLKAHSYQQGTNVVIGLGNSDQLTLANVKLSALDAGDFKFA